MHNSCVEAWSRLGGGVMTSQEGGAGNHNSVETSRTTTLLLLQLLSQLLHQQTDRQQAAGGNSQPAELNGCFCSTPAEQMCAGRRFQRLRARNRPHLQSASTLNESRGARGQQGDPSRPGPHQTWTHEHLRPSLDHNLSCSQEGHIWNIWPG